MNSHEITPAAASRPPYAVPVNHERTAVSARLAEFAESPQKTGFTPSQFWRIIVKHSRTLISCLVVALALRLNWEAADRIWRWAGDSATDENHYSKRLLLSEILTSTMVLRLKLGANAAAAHLDRRIDAVMAFEKWKGGIKPGNLGVRLAHGLGRLRYGRVSP